jgi:hypothetical protein
MIGVFIHIACFASSAMAAPITPEQLYAVYQSRDYFRLAREIGGLNPQDTHRVFFEGQLDAAFLKSKKADEELHHFLDLPGMVGDWRKEAWFTLAKDDFLCTEYKAAAGDLRRALAEPGGIFSELERNRAEGLLAMADALQSTPPQCRVDHTGASTVNATWNTVGSPHGGWPYIDYRVNGLTEEALFDTGSSLCFASVSFAYRHGLHIIAYNGNSTHKGGPVQSELGVADEVQIGSIQFRHVVFLITPEASLSFVPQGKLGSMIGLPLIVPLGHIRTSFDTNAMEVGLPPAAIKTAFYRNCNIAFNRLDLLVGLCYRGKELPFLLDTGADATNLYKGFSECFPEILHNSVTHKYGSVGIEGGSFSMEQIVPELQLGVNGTQRTLHDIPVAKQPNNQPPIFGQAGGDLLGKGFDLDFGCMTFSTLEGGNQ